MPEVAFGQASGGPQKTVIRGGYGIYYDQVLIGILEQNAFTNPPFATPLRFTGTVAAPITYRQPGGGHAAGHALRRAL